MDENIHMPICVKKNFNGIIHHFSNPLFKNAYLMMIGTIANSVLGFLFWMTATRYYAVEVVGLTSAIISSIGLLAIFSDLGLSIGLIRFLPNAGKNGNNMLNTFLTLIAFASAIIALVFLAGLDFWSPALLLLRQDKAFLITFVFFTMVTTLQSLVLNAFMAKRQAKFLVISTLISNLFKLALVILFAIFLNNAFGLFISTGLAGSIALVISIFCFLPKVQNGYLPSPMIKKEVLRDSWHYSISNYVARCLLQMTPLVLPIMVVNILSAKMNAYFVIAWAIASMLLVIPSSISTSLFAEGSNDEKSLKTNSKKALKLMILLLLPLSFLILIMADKLLQLFGQAYSDNGVLLLCILVLSATPYGINYFYISIARVNKNISSVIIITMATTFLSLGLSYFLMMKISLVGIGIGYLAGQSIVSIAVVILLWRSYHVHQG